MQKPVGLRESKAPVNTEIFLGCVLYYLPGISWTGLTKVVAQKMTPWLWYFGQCVFRGDGALNWNWWEKSNQLWKCNSLVEDGETWGYPSGLLTGSVSGSPLDLCH